MLFFICLLRHFSDEELIRWGWPEDVWFHVDKLSSAHVYLRLKEVHCDFEYIYIHILEIFRYTAEKYLYLNCINTLLKFRIKP